MIAIAVAGLLFGEEAVRRSIVAQMEGLIGTSGTEAILCFHSIHHLLPSDRVMQEIGQLNFAELYKNASISHLVYGKKIMEEMEHVESKACVNHTV